jgi:hypothetical protein
MDSHPDFLAGKTIHFKGNIMTNEAPIQELQQEAQAFASAFELNDRILNYSKLMDESASDNVANRGTLAVLRLHLTRMIVDVVRKYMQPADKVELEKVFASAAQAIAEARLQIHKRRDADPVRAKQLLNHLDALEGLARDYSTEILAEEVKGISL